MLQTDTLNFKLNNLLSQITLGQRAALEELYQLTSKHLFAVVSRICQQPALSEDVLQEVYINVWRNAGGYEVNRANPMAWLTSIARNKAIDALRKNKYLKQEMVLQSSESNTGYDNEINNDYLYQFADTRPEPAQLLVEAAQSMAIQDCLDKLSNDQQRSIALTFYNGLTHEETALQLNKPLGTIKTWVRRGLLALKPCLERASIGN